MAAAGSGRPAALENWGISFAAARRPCVGSWWIARGGSSRTGREPGGSREHRDFDVVAPVDEDHLLALNEVLERFAALDPAKAELVKLRYFVGLTLEQAAPILGISEPTAKRWWPYSKAWLYREMQRDAGG